MSRASKIGGRGDGHLYQQTNRVWAFVKHICPDMRGPLVYLLGCHSHNGLKDVERPVPVDIVTGRFFPRHQRVFFSGVDTIRLGGVEWGSRRSKGGAGHSICRLA